MNSYEFSTITFKVNGISQQVVAPPMKRLLDVLREDLKLTGTKEGCGEGECGACSIIINGQLANSCLIPIIQVENAEIYTVEGLASNEVLDRVQHAFLKYGGAQCGFCTPGMLMAATQLLQQNPTPNQSEIAEAISGNICRCTGYKKIFESVLKAYQEEEKA